MDPILNAAKFPFDRPEAQQLVMELAQLHPTEKAAFAFAEDAGLQAAFLAGGLPPYYLWRDILRDAATAGLTRKLIQKVHDRLNPASPKRPFLAALLANQP